MDSNAQGTFVTDRLAEGLARQTIRNWRDDATRGKARLVRTASLHFSTSKGAGRVVREMKRLLDPLAFYSASGGPKRRGVYQGWMLPELMEIDGTEHLTIEVNASVVDLGGFRPLGTRLVIFIHPHALARMFLRLQTTDLADVRREIESTVSFFAALADACHVLQLRQVVIPTLHGHFRCDVRSDVTEPCGLVAKTWIATATSGQRDAAVVLSFCDAISGWLEHSSALERVQVCIPLKSPETLVRRLVEALGSHTWLTEPYEERPDHLTALWEAARRQTVCDGT